MTTLEIYENVLVELNKVEAPSLLLNDFNYFLMKAIYQRVNKDYNFYDMNQQISDSLNPLTKTVELDLKDNRATVEDDYMHSLGCGVLFKIHSNKCNNYSLVNKGAIRLISDAREQVENNYYMKPSSKRPYYIIHNLSGQTVIEILCGSKTGHIAEKVRLRYLKKPQLMNLTDDQIDGLEQPQTMEFAEYICYEIINDMFKLIAENGSDPRLQSHLPINQTIAPPMQTGGLK